MSQLNLSVINDLVLEKSLSKSELAKKAGISEKTLHRCIKENSTKISTLLRIAEILNEPVSSYIINDQAEIELFDEKLYRLQKDKTIKKKDEEIQWLRNQLEEKTDYIGMLKREIKVLKGEVISEQ